jgi:hypothetical protein
MKWADSLMLLCAVLCVQAAVNYAGFLYRGSLCVCDW